MRAVMVVLTGLAMAVVAPGCGEAGGSDAGSDLPTDPGAPDLPEPAEPAGEVAGRDQVDAAPGPGDWHLPALVTCAPASPTCPVPVASGGPAASARRDVFYPYDLYPEASIPDPQGSRVQVAAVAAAGGPVTRVEILGTDVTAFALPAGADAPAPPEVQALVGPDGWQWVHVWPLEPVAGEPLFVTFHLATAKLAGHATLPVRVVTAAGEALQADVPLAEPAVPLTYVTTSADQGTLLVHVANADAVPHRLTALEVNGRDVTDAACVPSSTLAPGQAALWTVPLCSPLALGQAWTVVARFADAPSSVGVGRVVLPRFPIEGWGRDSECALPGANAANYQEVRSKGFDMFFLRSDYSSKESCNGATAGSILQAAAAEPDVLFMLDEWAPPDGLDLARQVRLLGDEVDTDEDDKPWRVSQDAKASWIAHPGLTTYIGGARHRRTGAFAGLADLQGFDIYNAACAPKMLDGGHWPSLRAPYDYCRSVRANHLPNPQWFYSQGIAGGWNLDTEPPTARQPDPAELKVQAMSVAACGSKGLMYFQTDLESAALVPATWEAMGQVNRDLRVVRDLLREGDVLGARSSELDVLVDAVRARAAIVVPVVNARAAVAMEEVRCFTEKDPHWGLAEVTTDVTLTVPDDLAVTGAFEIVDGHVTEVATGLTATGRDVTLGGVALSPDVPYRLYVLVGSAEAAAALESAAAAVGR